MIRSFNKMHGTLIRALDGYMGSLKDVYFDERTWRVKYFVAEFVTWFSKKDVLVPPDAVSPYDGISLSVELNKAELRECPLADSTLPVSLRGQYRERCLFNPLSFGESPINGSPIIVSSAENSAEIVSEVDPHLRSCKDVSNCKLTANDGDIGVIQDMLIDDSLWVIRFIVAKVNCGDDHENLYGPQFIEDINWALKTVKIGMNRNKALSQPRFDASRYLDISYEALLSEMYNPENKNKTAP